MQNSLKDQLIARLDRNLCDFHKYLNSLSRSKLIAIAGQIAAVTDAHWYLTTQYDWEEDEDEDISYLLLFQNPLSIMADAWENRRADNLVDFDEVIYEVFIDESVIADYPLLPNIAENVSGPKNAVTTTLLPLN